MSQDAICEAFDVIARLCIATGNAPIKGKLWDFVVDDRWQFAVNGTGGDATPAAAQGRMDAPVLHRFECAIWYNGFLAGIIGPHGGIIAAGEGANEDAFIEAVELKIAIVDANAYYDDPERDFDWNDADESAEVE